MMEPRHFNVANAQEFFALTGSLYLRWGNVGRPLNDRGTLHKQPIDDRWLGDLFSVPEKALSIRPGVKRTAPGR
jgi:hypothetical protein